MPAELREKVLSNEQGIPPHWLGNDNEVLQVLAAKDTDFVAEPPVHGGTLGQHLLKEGKGRERGCGAGSCILAIAAGARARVASLQCRLA